MSGPVNFSTGITGGSSISACDSVLFVVHQGLKSSSLVVKLYDTVKVVKVCKVFIRPFTMSSP
jgi:hypothetical protein